MYTYTYARMLRHKSEQITKDHYTNVIKCKAFRKVGVKPANETSDQRRLTNLEGKIKG